MSDTSDSSCPSSPTSALHYGREDFRQKAWTLCRKFLSGAWREITPERMKFRQLRGGLCNFMYYCALPEDVPSKGPRAVLLRIFGERVSSAVDQETMEVLFNEQITDNVISTLLSERKLGPTLYGVFPGGRIEEFIQSTPLINFQMCEPKHTTTLAKIFAGIHKMKVPIPKDGENYFFNTISKWLDALKRISPKDIGNAREAKFAEELLCYNYEEEVAWLKKVLPQLRSPIVFCHNDLQGGNILKRDEVVGNEENLVAIDFEFSGYNYRGYDIADHWIEWMFDYNGDSYPYYRVDESKFPSREQQVEFLNVYISECSSVPEKDLILNKRVEALMKEVHSFLAVPNLLWALWAIHQSVHSDLSFGFLHFAACKMDAYWKFKEELRKNMSTDKTRKISSENGEFAVKPDEILPKRIH